jgi:5,10-methylene-tetrahydrofolate dehydrogenase/methenyl tetrahydrofolate cyclohydrolase
MIGKVAVSKNRKKVASYRHPTSGGVGDVKSSCLLRKVILPARIIILPARENIAESVQTIP